jgi:hypothetical protein
LECWDIRKTSAEAKRACWIELQKLAKSTRIWESRIFWQILDREFKTHNLKKKAQNDFGISEAVEVSRIAAWASKRGSSKGRGTKRIGREYLEYLTDIFSRTSVSTALRTRVKALLCEILSQKELVDICFRSWKRDAQVISDNDDYLSRVQLYLPELNKSALMNDKQRDELYQLLGSNNENTRRRAQDRLSSVRFPN